MGSGLPARVILHRLPAPSIRRWMKKWLPDQRRFPSRTRVRVLLLQMPLARQGLHRIAWLGLVCVGAGYVEREREVNDRGRVMAQLSGGQRHRAVEIREGLGRWFCGKLLEKGVEQFFFTANATAQLGDEETEFLR
ncbi:hypothetical protein NITLEN_30389 [Nitrospira lenta]|uniref:Uncharacterized protein n=1 Tax=Nitrospira lenta TaxID=1436998 RepID=A0A330L6L2_9BACT|nr:hypothetical protein NITLEN_30389 [Nitrospira lenta]